MESDKPVMIIGGHGKIALRLARILSHHGTYVLSVIRNPDHAVEVKAAGAEPVIADVEELDVAKFAELFTGVTAVVWSAGAGGGNPERTYAVDRDAAIRSIDAAEHAEIDRYVMVSYDGARIDHGVPPDNSFYPYAQAKAAADERLRASELRWTIVGPGKLTDTPGQGTIGIGSDKLPSRETSRDDVAAVIGAVLRRPDTARRTIEFTDGDTPIGEAIARQ